MGNALRCISLVGLSLSLCVIIAVKNSRADPALEMEHVASGKTWHSGSEGVDNVLLGRCASTYMALYRRGKRESASCGAQQMAKKKRKQLGEDDDSRPVCDRQLDETGFQYVI